MTTKKDIAIINRLERENTKTPDYMYSHGIQIDGVGYEIFFNTHECMCMNDGTNENIPFDYEGDKPLPGCFSEILNGFMRDKDNYMTICPDMEDLKAAPKKVKGCVIPWTMTFEDLTTINVNPAYMIDHLNFCKTDKCYIAMNGFSEKTGVYDKPLIFMSNDGRRISMFLPIYVRNTEYERKHEKEAA